jgi:hypothetical protein
MYVCMYERDIEKARGQITKLFKHFKYSILPNLATFKHKIPAYWKEIKFDFHLHKGSTFPSNPLYGWNKPPKTSPLNNATIQQKKNPLSAQ